MDVSESSLPFSLFVFRRGYSQSCFTAQSMHVDIRFKAKPIDSAGCDRDENRVLVGEVEFSRLLASPAIQRCSSTVLTNGCDSASNDTVLNIMQQLSLLSISQYGCII